MPEIKETPASTPRRSAFEGASPNLTFWFGVIAGAAAVAIIGLAIIVPRAFSKTKTTTTTNTNAVAADPNAPQKFGDVTAVSDDDYINGKKDAKITLIEYSDLECPYCKRYHTVMLDVMKAYPDQVRWVFRQFPLSFHANAQKEAEAALCVGDLGGATKYWSFVDTIFERTSSNGTGFALTDLGPLAKEVGVNQTKFQKCLDDNTMAARVSAESQNAQAAGISGTPTTLIVGKDGKTISGVPGAYTLEEVKKLIDEALAA